MDELIVWKKAKGFGNKFDIDQVMENADGLRILLTEVNTNQKISLSYDGLVCSYKNTDESFCLPTLSALGKTYGMNFIAQNTFFEVLNSSYVKEIESGGHGVLRAQDLFHLKIMGANAIFDIVSFARPVIQKEDAYVLEND